MRIIKSSRPPTGIVAAMFRLPVYLYRVGLGWLFGHRLLLLTHVGRVSHRQRQTVLEVVEHRRADSSYVVASGWGPTAQWYQNVVRQPTVMIHVGRRGRRAKAVPLSADEGAEVFADYARRHRLVAKHLLPRLLGFSVDGSDNDFRAVGQQIPFVRFVADPSDEPIRADRSWYAHWVG